ncbi:hypothetical protein N5J31_08700 [Acinetobacter johnsonii]|uniref:hypothetical protein n=1 Tax=Acinetobacter johnsonii TaxID=40214 RepID=UPI0024497B15|nr:hypothetical protein [Acinetobacter johnsonii]MDH2046982.1 hypothetical protein [Acinetobacter johnsonii]
MKKATLVHPLMSEAFLIWLEKLGYKGVARAGVISFYHEINNRNFPRGVMILENGRLNRPAAKLFAEFKKHDPFNEVAA